MAKLKAKGDDKTITVRVPIAIRKRGGRKLVIAPDGSPASPMAGPRVDDALLKAIARAFRWQELLENGTYATIAEIAEAEKINETYVGRVLRLALLKPAIVQSILDELPILQLNDLMKTFPIEWNVQDSHFGIRKELGSMSASKGLCRLEPAARLS
ncbi:hypothetical protein [Rhodoplanes sp. Z2-YC6860]|uniref:hypothetical protein n=1 Tax=Rhodoplanes sp. Z2-YC6860 TaxID=674703 RepID=UPI00078D2D1E|nr:hypothetical protein [Rhodoplanes sp. Z2-YC6860]AMN44051.1 regulatory protein, LacI family [Rhodoplanes sp. Z2-YC6860]